MPPRLTSADLLYIGLGGMLGSLLRWWIGLGFGGEFPAPTLFVNILGAAALGILYATQHRLHPRGRYLYMVGFCGSFTTVSLFSLETLLLLEEGRYLAAGSNVLIPVGVALAVVALIIRPLEVAVERRRK